MDRSYFKKLSRFAIYGTFIGLISVTLYPIVIYPMLNPDYYKKIQAENRKNIKQEDIQPGNMKIWSDPFDRKK
ncbi:small integral membrane protein 20-like [Hyalella azteca]|uniref:Small integral membrane protein 20-like n=1 Tax=Hyalella azteca TaxID=294128 RepID=A0A979FNA4_HYAAZ|nr:small integral membrane protein 20-like [Hyalella azteca]